MAVRLSILLLTEDTGGDAFETVKAVAHKLLFAVDGAIDISRIEFSEADEAARVGMGFHRYRSKNPRDNRYKVDLAQSIATRLLRGDLDPFVFVHVDGDRKWEERGQEPDEPLCTNKRDFQRDVLPRVQALLEQARRSEQSVRIRFVVPFWSIEAWLYQNTREARKICDEHAPRYERDRDIFDGWEREPRALDEFVQPKERGPSFHDKFNRQLAASLPGAKVRAVGKSFAHTIEHLASSDELRAALERVRFGA
jgi:hypothetical protein